MQIENFSQKDNTTYTENWRKSFQILFVWIFQYFGKNFTESDAFEDPADSEKINNINLSIFLIHIHFLRHKTDELYSWLKNLHFLEIIAITEHWLNIDEPAFVQNHTTIARWNRSYSSHGGALLMFSSNHFTAVTIFNSLISENYSSFWLCIMKSTIFALYISTELLTLTFIYFLKSFSAQESLESQLASSVLVMHGNYPTRITRIWKTVLF